MKTTLEELPVITGETLEEIISVRIDNPKIYDSWARSFLETNPLLFDNLTPLTILYPFISKPLRNTLCFNYELLRRESEKMGLSLPKVENKTICELLFSVLRDVSIRERHLNELGEENPLYLLTLADIREHYEKKFSVEIVSEIINLPIQTYHMLKEQSRKNKIQSN